jgi:TonB family protein
VIQVLSTAFIQTNSRERISDQRVPLITQAMVLQDPADPRMGLPASPAFRMDDPNDGAVSVAPRMLDGSLSDLKVYARRAGLQPGQSAFVVLLIEVLPDGRVGQVQVDVSSGLEQVDLAAVEYARSLEWIGGRSADNEYSIRIRYGVRLSA